jgi:hypothetical protein
MRNMIEFERKARGTAGMHANERERLILDLIGRDGFTSFKALERLVEASPRRSGATWSGWRARAGYPACAAAHG